ncbi:MmgE/PrpD family protein [Desulfosarcina cetonica]|uniref:MmgE/PrpD family protein n=1 Tax=Desulfosarcina cetonica TaxID=90730 RepID=UPI0006D12AA0|nr:MmgE/PrpD family protein [Desulfosarcina cetonica]VTR71578.1 MmgE/PrpD family protein [Desulfosarcina cetonica]
MTIARRFADYIHRTTYEDIPKDIQRFAKLCIFDWIGVTLGGAREPVSDILLGLIDIMGGNPHATIIGKGVKTNALFAALINGTMSHALDFDDTHKGAGIHPSVCLAPAAVAVAEYKRASGKDLITAFIIGFEVAARIGIAAATIGRFGATASASKLMGLTAEQIVNAFGITGTQVSGLREVFGTMSKPFHAGKAAMDGVLSIALARRNFDSSHEIFEGRFGLKNVFSPKSQYSDMLTGLGKQYHIQDIAFKPYASALATHSTIQAIEAMRKEETVTAADVESVQIEFGPLPYSVVNRKNPQKVLEGKFSVQHCAAIAFIRGRVGRDMFTLNELNDPQIVAFRERVDVLLNPDLTTFETIVTVKTKQGASLKQHIRESKGSPGVPLSFAEMKEKFMDLATSVISKDNAEKIVEKIGRLQDIEDVTEIISLCNPASR